MEKEEGEREEGARGRRRFCVNSGRRCSEELILHKSRGGKNSVPGTLLLQIHVNEHFTMARTVPNGIVQAMQSLRLHVPPSYRSTIPTLRRQARAYATEAEVQPSSTEIQPSEVHAAPEINFNQFEAKPARIVPASPSYFSGSPRFIDNVLKLEALQAKYASLPTVSAGEAPRMAWFKLAQFRDFVGEPVPMKKYKSLLKILQRLNRIQPEMVPDEVRQVLNKFLRPGNPYAAQTVPRTVDENGRARAKGKRKESTAVVQLVEGEGEIMVNGKSLVEVFQRVHDRESALWALRCTQRMDKYNAWITVKGGGVTGQAEAITLAIARALLLHEPGLKPVLRKGKSCSVFCRDHLLTFSQLVSLPSMLVVSRERRRVMSRPAKCPPGSSVRMVHRAALSFLLPIMYYFTSYDGSSQPCSISCTRSIWVHPMALWLFQFTGGRLFFLSPDKGDIPGTRAKIASCPKHLVPLAAAYT